jgi:hypothetical protein
MVALRIRDDIKFALGGPLTYKALRGLAIDNARLKLEVAGVPDFTDNTGGTGAFSFADVPLPVASISATAAGGVTLAAFNTSLGKIENAFRVLVNSINNARGRIGLPLLIATSGVQASANTLAALDLAGAAGNGAGVADFATAFAAMLVAKQSLNTIENSFTHVSDAIGNNRELLGLRVQTANLTNVITPLPAVTASPDGTSALAKVDADAFLSGMANSIASVALRWNQIFVQGGVPAITDSTGGAVAGGLVANAAPAGVPGVATTSAPKAGFDAQLALVANAIASLAKQVNIMRGAFDLPLVADTTGGTASATLAAETPALTAVDGSSGTIALDVVTATAAMNKVNDDLSTLAAATNDLVNQLGEVPPLTDALGGNILATLLPLGATGAGVGGGGNVTMLNTAVITWLTNTRNNVASIAAALNGIVGANTIYKPLSVVAG